MRIIFCVILLLFSLYSNSSFSLEGADTKKLLQISKAWKVFSAIQNGRRIYYINSSAIDQDSKKNNKSITTKPSVTVTCISNKIDEVSVASRFLYNNIYPNVIIDNKKICDLSVTEERFAWASDINTDKEIIENMKKGRWLIIESTHSK